MSVLAVCKCNAVASQEIIKKAIAHLAEKYGKTVLTQVTDYYSNKQDVIAGFQIPNSSYAIGVRLNGDELEFVYDQDCNVSTLRQEIEKTIEDFKRKEIQRIKLALIRAARKSGFRIDEIKRIGAKKLKIKGVK